MTRWADLSDEVLESVETGRKATIEAVHKFIDEVTPMLADQSRRKTSSTPTWDWLRSSSWRRSGSCAALCEVWPRRRARSSRPVGWPKWVGGPWALGTLERSVAEARRVALPMIPNSKR